MSRYAYNDKDPAAFTVWWLNADRDADMDCGSFPTQEEAEAALPAIVAELIGECAQDADQVAAIMAGSFHLEFPETEDGERGATEPMGWPGDHPLSLIKNRQRAFTRAKTYMVSTPTTAGQSRIEQIFLRYDQRHAMDRHDQEDLDHGLPEHLRDYDAYTWE